MDTLWLWFSVAYRVAVFLCGHTLVVGGIQGGRVSVWTHSGCGLV